MGLSKELQERWERMLRSPDRGEKLRALTEIGQAHDLVGSEESPLEKVRLGGAMSTRSETETLPTTLKDLILEELRSSKDPIVRAEAVLALVHWRDEETVNAILQMLNDQDSTVRLAAVQALATMGDAQFIPSLLEVAESDPEELVRAHALSALEQIPKQAVKGWQKGGTSDLVRGGAERTSGAIRARGGTGIPDLATALEQIASTDTSRYVAFLAQKARKRFV